MQEYRVTSGQSLFDVSIQLYGDSSHVLDIINNNPQLFLTINSNLESNSIIKYNDQNNTITNYFATNNLKLVTSDPKTIEGASYNNDYGTDYDS